MSKTQQLMQEARTLATLINTDRFLGVVPSEDLTVRLVEVLDTLSEECVV